MSTTIWKRFHNHIFIFYNCTLNVNNSLFYQTFMIYMYLINGGMAMIKRKVYLLVNTLRVNDNSVICFS